MMYYFLFFSQYAADFQDEDGVGSCEVGRSRIEDGI